MQSDSDCGESFLRRPFFKVRLYHSLDVWSCSIQNQAAAEKGQKTPSSLWWEKSVCCDECWRVEASFPEDFLSPTRCCFSLQTGQQTGGGEDLFLLSSEKGEGKQETEWKFNQPSLLEGWPGVRRIYSCLASFDSTCITAAAHLSPSVRRRAQPSSVSMLFIRRLHEMQLLPEKHLHRMTFFCSRSSRE